MYVCVCVRARAPAYEISGFYGEHAYFLLGADIVYSGRRLLRSGRNTRPFSFQPEGVGSIFLRNVGINLADYMLS
jgi:hypothetical protein